MKGKIKMKYEKEGEILERDCCIGNVPCIKGNQIWTVKLNGEEVLHRDGGPARIYYHDNDGEISVEFYYINGKVHREEGPARIWYYKKEIFHEEYYLNNEYLFAANKFSEIQINKTKIMFEKKVKEYLMKELYE